MNPTTSVITLRRADIRLELLTLGATLRRFEVLIGQTWRNIVLGHPDLADYVANVGYLGSTVGRVANRMGGARFSLDGVDYPLAANAGVNQLHGGPGGFSTREWDVLGQGADWVEFGLTSADGDQGYPGEVAVRARFELLDDGAQVHFWAATDAPTVVNLTTHPYFNLDGEGSGSVEGHRLQIPSEAFTPLHPDGVPTGEIRGVAGTALDFRDGQLIGTARERAVAEGLDRDNGIDHNFAIEGSGPREQLRLFGADGLTLTVFSDLPGVQVYTGNHFAGEPGTSGLPYPVWAGVAVEPQGFPDAPNHANFPPVVLRPGEEYTTTTRWQLTRPE